MNRMFLCARACGRFRSRWVKIRSHQASHSCSKQNRTHQDHHRTHQDYHRTRHSDHTSPAAERSPSETAAKRFPSEISKPKIAEACSFYLVLFLCCSWNWKRKRSALITTSSWLIVVRPQCRLPLGEQKRNPIKFQFIELHYTQQGTGSLSVKLGNTVFSWEQEPCGGVATGRSTFGGQSSWNPNIVLDSWCRTTLSFSISHCRIIAPVTATAHGEGRGSF
jgi:hypothetical protein